jgi:putative chitinase
MITVELLNRITGTSSFADRKKALIDRMTAIGGPLNEPAVTAQFLAQVLHESGSFRHVREIWGPTKAQAGYEGRADLGNVRPGDGKRFMGRDLIQNTGRANYRNLTLWGRKAIGSELPDFEVHPEALEQPQYLGLAAVWFFLVRPKLIEYCRAGNIEMVTRIVNGGLNGYADRLKWYDRTALAMLGMQSIPQFQASAGLAIDGISGPKTRAALHDWLKRLPEKAPEASPGGPGLAQPTLPTKPPGDGVEAPPAPRSGWLTTILAFIKERLS